MTTAVIDALVLVQPLPLEKLFERATIDPILEQIKAQCRAVPTDISTESGRKAVASLAFKIAKTKTFIESQRITLVASEKKRLAVIDAEGKRIRDELDALKDEVRQPLTEWENAETQRINKHELIIADLADAANMGLATTADIETRITHLKSFSLAGMQEFTKRAEETRAASLVSLRTRLEESHREDRERAEVARLRQEQEARAQKQRDETIAAKARADAEIQIREAETRAAQAEEDKQRTIAKALANEIAAKKRADEDKTKAIQKERERVERQRQAEADAEAKRESSKRHRTKINNEAIAAFAEFGIDTAIAKKVVDLIAMGQIPNIKISY